MMKKITLPGNSRIILINSTRYSRCTNRLIELDTINAELSRRARCRQLGVGTWQYGS
ncbi:MAG: hypothetical protein IPI17_19250 [Nitrosomonas sp.]|nr:hypothetical protein [Nitrosomonas sp.]